MKMPMKTAKCVIVTGTPGCGKTRIAKALARELGWVYVDGKRIVAALPSRYDHHRRCRIVDEHAFAKAAQKRIEKLYGRAVIDSHLSHFIDPTVCRACIVVTCPLDILRDRLKRRGYLMKKIEDNLQCEIMETCKIEALERGHRVIEVAGIGTPNLHAIRKRLRVGNDLAKAKRKRKGRKEKKKRTRIR